MGLLDLSIKAGIEASLAVMDVYTRDFGVYQKEDHSPVTDADLESTRIIESILAASQLPIISEEKELPPYEERKNFDSYFLIDPLDGTKEFVGRTGEFCINIALIENNVPVMGLIVDPSSNELLVGGDYNSEITRISFSPEGTIKSKEPLIVDATNQNSPSDSLRLICSRRANENRLIESARDLFAVKNYEVKKKGSALKFIDLALNRADYYLRYGKTMEWDIAPGFAILKYLNGSIDELGTGKEIRFNKENLLNPPFLAYNKKLHE